MCSFGFDVVASNAAGAGVGVEVSAVVAGIAQGCVTALAVSLDDVVGLTFGAGTAVLDALGAEGTQGNAAGSADSAVEVVAHGAGSAGVAVEAAVAAVGVESGVAAPTVGV